MPSLLCITDIFSNVKHSRQPHLREAYILVRSFFARRMTSDPRQIGTGPPVIFHYPHYHSWTPTGYEPKLKTRTRLPRHPHNHYYWRTCQTYVRHLRKLTSRVCSTWHTSGYRGCSIRDKSGRRCCRPQEGRIKGLLNSLVYKVLLIWHIKHPHKWIRRH